MPLSHKHFESMFFLQAIMYCCLRWTWLKYLLLLLCIASVLVPLRMINPGINIKPHANVHDYSQMFLPSGVYSIAGSCPPSHHKQTNRYSIGKKRNQEEPKNNLQTLVSMLPSAGSHKKDSLTISLNLSAIRTAGSFYNSLEHILTQLLLIFHLFHLEIQKAFDDIFQENFQNKKYSK